MTAEPLLLLFPAGVWLSEGFLFLGLTHEAGRGYRVFSHLYPLGILVLHPLAFGAAAGDGGAAAGDGGAAAGDGGAAGATRWALATALAALGTAPFLLAERSRPVGLHLPAVSLVPAFLALAGGIAALRAAGEAPVGAGAAALGCTLLGAVVQAMVFGHWYFVRPKMSPAPLVVALDRLLALSLLRAATAIAGIAAFAPWSAWLTSEAFLAGGFGEPMVALVRVLLGAVGLPLIVAGAKGCARIGAVQPATGMLYAAIFFAAFAELAAFVLTAGGVPA